MRNEDKRTWAEISLAILNTITTKSGAPCPRGRAFMGLCKANAYGHGAVPIATHREELGADYLAVSCYEEAAELRAAGVTAPVLILAPSPSFIAGDIARLPRRAGYRGHRLRPGDKPTPRRLGRAAQVPHQARDGHGPDGLQRPLRAGDGGGGEHRRAAGAGDNGRFYAFRRCGRAGATLR